MLYPPPPDHVCVPLWGVWGCPGQGVPSLSIKQRRCCPHQLLISSPHHIHQKCHQGGTPRWGGPYSNSGALQGGVSQCGRPKQFVRGGRRWGWVYGISLLWGVRGVGLGAMWEACTSSIPHIPQGWCFMRGGLYTLQLGIGARQKESSERGVSRVLLWGTFFVVFVIHILTESV